MSTVPMADSKPARVRRKSAPGSEHIKHRRTRSGCYTCRSRRVKCDETRPICERCRKGARECVYPDTASSSKSQPSGRGDVIPEAQEGSSESGDDENEDEDEDLMESESAGSERKKSWTTQSDDIDSSKQKGSGKGLKSLSKKSSTNSSLGLDRNTGQRPEMFLLGEGLTTSPTVSRDSAFQSRNLSDLSPAMTRKFTSTRAKLDAEMKFLLAYHQNNITYHHYSLKSDCSQLLKTTFIEMALQDEPFLYSILAFAAYHYTLSNPNGQIRDFLKYHNKSVSLLRSSLLKTKKHSEARLLTILQLATMEEYFGHWENLLGHQKAALEILKKLYTPSNICETQLSRMTLGWYTRFDVFAGMLGGSKIKLGRNWFEECHRFNLDQSRMMPEEVSVRIDSKTSEIRLLAMDITELMAKRASTNLEQFLSEDSVMYQKIAAWSNDVDHRLIDPASLISHEGFKQPSNESCPFEPASLLGGRLWQMNFALNDWYATDIMHRLQTSQVLRQSPPPEVESLAVKICQIVEAIARWPEAPLGSLIAMQASLAFASLFLPRDYQHAMWARRKFAEIERMGFIYPPSLRSKLAQIWGDPSVLQWWLPNDEGYPRIIKDIRTFVEERTLPPKDASSSDIREMKTIFSAMNLDNASPTTSDPNSASQGSEEAMAGLFAPSMNEVPLESPMVPTSSANWGYNETVQAEQQRMFFLQQQMQQQQSQQQHQQYFPPGQYGPGDLQRYR